jgi:hypothetical protein
MRRAPSWADAAVPAPVAIAKPFETKAIASGRQAAWPGRSRQKGCGRSWDWAPRPVTLSRLACRSAPVCRCEESRRDCARAGRAGGWAGGPARQSNWDKARGAFARSPRKTCTRTNRSARRESPAANPDRSTHSRVGSRASSSPSARTRWLIACERSLSLFSETLSPSATLFLSEDFRSAAGGSPRGRKKGVCRESRESSGVSDPAVRLYSGPDRRGPNISNHGDANALLPRAPLGHRSHLRTKSSRGMT